MRYDEYEELCRREWEDVYNYLWIDRSKNRDQGIYCICNESKNKYKECNPETNFF